MNHDKMSNISAKRGFLWPSFEIYSGVSGFTDYGPLGASLKNNIMQHWRKQYVSGEGFYEIEGPTVMPKEVLKASGHVDNFTDPMCKCENCGEVYRADHIIEEVVGYDVESLENEELDKIVADNNIRCPECEGKITLEISNIGAMPVALYPGQRVCQIVFETMTTPSEIPYGHPDRNSKYMGQVSPESSRVKLDYELKKD